MGDQWVIYGRIPEPARAKSHPGSTKVATKVHGRVKRRRLLPSRGATLDRILTQVIVRGDEPGSPTTSNCAFERCAARFPREGWNRCFRASAAGCGKSGPSVAVPFELMPAEASPSTSQQPSAGPPAEPKRPERVAYIDVARAIGVVGVVLGHAWFGSLAERITLTFDLALFFFVSGFVYSEKYSSRPDLLAWRRMKTLYLPFIRWGLFWLALHNVLFSLGIYNAQTGYLDEPGKRYLAADFLDAAIRILTFRNTESMSGALWFLQSLFLTNVFFGVLSFGLIKLFQRPVEWLRAMLVVLLAVAGLFSNPVLNNRFHLGTSLVALLVFYGGFLFARQQGRIRLVWWAAVPAAVLVLLNRGYVFLGSNSYEYPWLLVTVVPAGIYASLWLSKQLERNRLLQYIGTNTIFIIATHFLAFKVVSLIQIQVYGYPDFYLAKFPVISGAGGWWIAYFACGLFLPLGVKYAFDRCLLRYSTR